MVENWLMKSKKLNSLRNFASIDTLLDPQCMRLQGGEAKPYPFYSFQVLKKSFLVGDIPREKFLLSDGFRMNPIHSKLG